MSVKYFDIRGSRIGHPETKEIAQMGDNRVIPMSCKNSVKMAPQAVTADRAGICMMLIAVQQQKVSGGYCSCLPLKFQKDFSLLNI